MAWVVVRQSTSATWEPYNSNLARLHTLSKETCTSIYISICYLFVCYMYIYIYIHTYTECVCMLYIYNIHTYIRTYTEYVCAYVCMYVGQSMKLTGLVNPVVGKRFRIAASACCSPQPCHRLQTPLTARKSEIRTRTHTPSLSLSIDMFICYVVIM